MNDKPKVYSPIVSLIQGKASRYLLDLIEDEYNRIRMIFIEDIGEDIVMFTDSHQLSVTGCNCPFFMQHSAPCAHMFKYAGKDAFALLHLGWKVCDEIVPEPSILHGPTQVPQVSAEVMIQGEAMALAANVHARLLDVNPSTSIMFSRKFLEMLDRGSLHEPGMLQDSLVSRTRGRPRKPIRNTFRGNLNF